jgi:hypothetical protein
MDLEQQQGFQAAAFNYPKEALSNFKIGVYDPPTSRYQDAKDKRL